MRDYTYVCIIDTYLNFVSQFISELKGQGSHELIYPYMYCNVHTCFLIPKLHLRRLYAFSTYNLENNILFKGDDILSHLILIWTYLNGQ